MLRSIMSVISFAFLSLLISCSDDPVKPVENKNLITVQVLDSANNKPISNHSISIYYALEKTNEVPEDSLFKCYPNPIIDYCVLEYYLETNSSVKITLNDAINDTLVKELYYAENLKSGFYSININSDSLKPGIYKANLYINNSLNRSVTILKQYDYFILLNNLMVLPYATPLQKLTTDANGYITVDMTQFRYIGQKINNTNSIAFSYGILEVINGFYLLTEIEDGKWITGHSVRVSDCLNNKYIWKASR